MKKGKQSNKLAVGAQSRGARPKRLDYVLDDLIAQCNLTALMPKDLANWNWVAPVGREFNAESHVEKRKY